MPNKKILLVLMNSILVVMPMFFSCTTYNIDDYQTLNTIRIAAVGDSITYGFTIKNKNKNSYPAQLKTMLGNSWSVLNFGVNGTTVLKKGDQPYWNQRQLQDAYKFMPNVVVINFGTNDSKQQNWQYRDEFIADYIELITRFQQLESCPKIYICYPTPAYSEKFSINPKIIQNEIPLLINKISKQTGVEIIDLYTPLSKKPELFTDTIHPNADGALIVAKTVFNKMANSSFQPYSTLRQNPSSDF